LYEQLCISAEAFGELVLPDFRPRCFWLKREAKNKLQQEAML